VRTTYHLPQNCVLKQFTFEGDNPIKVSELFECEASVMYKLSDDQIPKFCEQFKPRTATGGSLFIVQNYVEGDNYWLVLDRHKRSFSAKSVAVQKKLKATNQSINKFYKKVDKAFYQKHPELKNRDLQPNEADRQLRFEWWSIAENMVD
jgi:serine/threonine protein kinase